MNTKTNPYEHVVDCILKDVLDGVTATPDDIAHSIMFTVVEETHSPTPRFGKGEIIDTMCGHHNRGRYTEAVKELRNYWKKEEQ